MLLLRELLTYKFRFLENQNHKINLDFLLVDDTMDLYYECLERILDFVNFLNYILFNRFDIFKNKL